MSHRAVFQGPFILFIDDLLLYDRSCTLPCSLTTESRFYEPEYDYNPVQNEWNNTIGDFFYRMQI